MSASQHMLLVLISDAAVKKEGVNGKEDELGVGGGLSPPEPSVCCTMTAERSENKSSRRLTTLHAKCAFR